jgi:hypothetical protein
MFSFDSGNLTAYLLKTTDTGESFTFKLEKDFQSFENELVNIISDYNNLIQWLDDNNEIINSGLKATLLGEVISITIKNKNLMKLTDTSSLVGKLGASAQVDNKADIDKIFGKIESNYVFAKNSLFSYDTAIGARSLYHQNIEPLINCMHRNHFSPSVFKKKWGINLGSICSGFTSLYSSSIS